MYEVHPGGAGNGCQVQPPAGLGVPSVCCRRVWFLAICRAGSVPGVKLRPRLGVAIAEVASLKGEYKSRPRDLVIVVRRGEEKNLAWATMQGFWPRFGAGLTVNGLQ